METLLSDIKYGLRLIIKNPVFSLVVVVALALGIGANTAIFSVLNAVLLKPLPYADSEHLVMMWQRFTGIGVPKDQNWTSPPEFSDVRRHQSSFSDIAAIQGTSFSILVGDTPERILGQFVSPSFFKLLGVEAFLGRTFSPDEEQQGKEAVVVMSHGLWQRRFASDRALIERTLNMNGRPYQVIGIAPPGFRDPVQPEAEMWAALSFTDQQLTQRGSHGLLVIARIKPELTLEQARSDMARVSERIIEGAPEYPYAKFGYRVLINPLLEEAVGDIRPALMMLMGSVGLVLLIACTNVANLMLVRASAREREIGIRTALGAGRGRLMRQMLTESVVLSLIGAIVGVALARVGVSVLSTMAAQSFPRLADTRIDLLALTFTVVVALATGILFGLFPAFQSARGATQDVLKEGSQASTTGRGRLRLRRVLVAAEVALSLLLLVGAGLLIKSFMRLQAVDAGFDPSGVLTMRIVVPTVRYSQPDQVRNFYQEVLRRVAGLPGVTKVGASNGIPLSGAGGSGTTTIDNPAFPDDRGTPEADQRIVTLGYFEAMGMTLLSGRVFDERDSSTGQPVAIIDETMARTFWPNEDAIGKRLKRGGRQSTQPWLTIVGVVRHVRYRTLEEPSRVQLYMPHAQVPTTGMSLAIKADVDPRTLVQQHPAGSDRRRSRAAGLGHSHDGRADGHVGDAATVDHDAAHALCRHRVDAGCRRNLRRHFVLGHAALARDWHSRRHRGEPAGRLEDGARTEHVGRADWRGDRPRRRGRPDPGHGDAALQRLDDRCRHVCRLLGGADSGRPARELPAGQRATRIDPVTMLRQQ